MSRSWNTWLTHWKNKLGTKRQPSRREGSTVRLHAEMLETRATPAVVYGLDLAQASNPAGSIVKPDKTPPVLTLQALSSTNVSTNQTITGTITDNVSRGLSVTVNVDGGSPQIVPVGAGGAFSYTSTLALDGSADGQHTFYFVGRDAAGNVGIAQSSVFTLTTSTTPLTLKLDPASDTGTAGNNITELSTVTLDGTGPVSTTITLTQTGATTQSDASGNFTFTNVPLSTGPNTLTVTATDAANHNLSKSLTVIRDTAPTVAAPVSNFSVAAGTAKSVFNMPTIFSDQDVNSLVQVTTNRGTFDVELFNQQVGNTVSNFLSYVNGAAGANYNNTIFHRVTNVSTDGIGVLQGGGFQLVTGSSGTTLPAITTSPAINLQAGMTNALGTIAMARTSDPNSATSQFFFNTVDNSVLDVGGGADPNGYAVFGVIRGSGLSVVQASAAVPPVNQGGNFAAIPLSGGIAANDPNFPTDTTASDYEVVQSMSVIRSPNAGFADSLTFTVSGNTNPTLVTPTINADGELTLAYASGQTGVATISLTATDSDGATAQTSFTVTVGSDTQAPVVTITSPASGASVKQNPAITGTATDNLAVTSLSAAVDNGAAQTVTVNSDGTFTFTPNLATDGSADGKHTVTFTAMDAAGNTSTPAVLNFTLDTTAPVVAITSPTSGQSFTTNPTITGTAMDNEQLAGLTATVDGGTAQPVTVDSSGNFSFTTALPTDGSANGAHTVVFNGTDAAGNTSTPQTFTFTLTSQSPAVTLTAPADGQTFNSVPAFTGTITDVSQAGNLSAIVDNGSPQAVTVDGSGNFSFTPSVSADGMHTVTFTINNQFTDVTRTFTLDTTAPVVTVTSPANGQSFTSPPTIVGTAVDATSGLSSLTVSVDNVFPATVVPVDSQGNFSFTPHLATDGTADGMHTAEFTATDVAGNVAAPVDVTFTLDTTAPLVHFISPPSGTVLNTNPTIVGTAVDNTGVSKLTVSVDGGTPQSLSVNSQGDFSFTPNLPLDGSADGSHQYVFIAQDAAGNTTTASEVVYLATQPPVVTIDSPANGQTFSTNPTIQGHATSSVGVGSILVSVDGTLVTTILSPLNGDFTFTPSLPLDGSANGQHTVTFVAQDPVPNQSAPVSLTFNLQAP